MDDKSVSALELETKAIPLQVALPIILLSFLVGVTGYALVRSEVLRQNMGAVAWFIFWCILIVVGLITVLFSDIRIDKQGISFRTPWVRLLGFKGFPVRFSFDEARIKFRWGGRLLIINKGNFWVNLLLYSFWVMPFKWKESMEIIKEIQRHITL